MFYSIRFLIDLHSHGVPEANQTGCPRANLGQLDYKGRIGRTSFPLGVENEQSIKLTYFKNGPTWDRSHC